MRLNRVLLLAASINMAMLATVFTISCSGDDGKSGTSCDAQPNGSGGYDIICGGAVKGQIGGDGVSENVCRLELATGGIKCGDESFTFDDPGSGPASGCVLSKEDEYNDNEVRVRCGANTLYMCGGTFFVKGDGGPSGQYCYNGSERTEDKNKLKYVANGGNYLLDAKDFWCDGNEDYYDPNKKFCQEVTLGNYKTEDLCGPNDFGSSQFCYADKDGKKGARFKCGSAARKEYTNAEFCLVLNKADYSGQEMSKDLSQSEAAGGTITSLCGGEEYGNEKTTSRTVPAKNSMNGNPLSEEVPFLTDCVNNVTVRECGDKTFNYRTHFCQNIDTGVGTVAALCGSGTSGKQYGDGFDANEDEIEAKDNTINGLISLEGEAGTKCEANNVVYQCGTGLTGSPESFYDIETWFCRDKALRPAASIEREVAKLCGSVTNSEGIDRTRSERVYDGETYHCDETTGNVSVKCGTKFYVESKQFCWDPVASSIGDKCKHDEGNYNPSTTFCGFAIDGAAAASDFLAVEDNQALDKETGAIVESKIAEVPVDLCGAAKVKINEGKWKWEYCYDGERVPCGVGQQAVSKTACSIITCKDGKMRAADGYLCVSSCEEGFEANSAETMCVKSASLPTCTEGIHLAAAGVTCRDACSSTTGPGYVWGNSTGTWKCEEAATCDDPAEVVGVDGACKATCDVNSTENSSGVCICNSPAYATNGSACVVAQDCVAGMNDTPDNVPCNDVCTGGESWGDSGSTGTYKCE